MESNGPGSQAPTGWNPDSLGGTHLGSCWLEDPLSIGSMGAVFLARQERPHRYVAVKVIHRKATSEPAAWALFLARFQREADATAALDHANIVPIYEFGETGDLAYLVMPYLPDGSLATRLEQHGPLPLPVTLLAIEQVAAALDYAHARGIVHRDVKPSNMLLHPDGRVLLADFGIARPLHLPDPDLESTSGSGGSQWSDAGSEADRATLTQAGTAMGTPEYMAPEQVRVEAITPATDTYALGIATYELLGGQTPFAGANVPTILLRQISAPPPPLRSLRSDLPARVEEVVFWALAKDPADRPTSAGAYAKALRAAIENSTPLGTGGWPAQLAAASVTGPGSRNESLYSSHHPASPDHTLAMPPGAMPLVKEPEFTVDEDPAGDTTLGGPNLPIAYGGAWPEATRYGGRDGGRGGFRRAPLWPTPRPADGRKPSTGQIAAVGLAVSCVALLILSALLIGSIHSVAGGTPGGTPGGAPATATSFSAPPGKPTVTPAPTISRPEPTATRISITPVPTTVTTPIPGDNSMAVSPTQMAFGCPPPQVQTVQLSNAGPVSVLWTARTSGGRPGTTISMSPASGSLPAGGSQTITITETSASLSSSQGSILFVDESGQSVGNPAQVNYTVPVCNGGG